MDKSDDQRIQDNVAGGFRGVLDNAAAASRWPPHPDVEGKVQVAFEAWQAGEYNLAVSLLLDAMIKQRERG